MPELAIATSPVSGYPEPGAWGDVGGRSTTEWVACGTAIRRAEDD